MRGVRLVVDASALVYAFTDGTPSGTAARQRLRESVRHAPYLVDAEVGNVLRRMAARGTLSAANAERVRSLAAAAVSRRHSHLGALGARAWQLRHNVTFYDGLYVALAEMIGCPLLTADRRLSGASGPKCSMELVAP